MVTIKLTNKQAELVAHNVDGWIDAGSCEGGLTEAEKTALNTVYRQIRVQLRKKVTRNAIRAASASMPADGTSSPHSC